jgi:phosphoribosyl-ATP pyrophosphohydrolase
MSDEAVTDAHVTGKPVTDKPVTDKGGSDAVLDRLAALIMARRAESASKSYTRELLDGGPRRCAKKVGEEATETVIAALVEDRRALIREAADLIYHLLVLLESKHVSLSEVLAELNARIGTSGHAEKASREVKPS